MKIEIIPAILSTTSGDYHQKFKAVEPFTDWIQVDIVDNKFARNLTVGPKEVASMRTAKKLEIQLMVDFIEDWIDPFIEIRGRTNIARIIVPYESCRDPIEVVNHIRQHGLEIGFSLNPDTPADKIRHLVDKIDVVLLLSVHPGFSGQHFVYGTLEKIRQVKAMNPSISVEIDGGIEPGTARKCAEVGADILAAGSFVFENDKVGGTTYKEKVKNALNMLKQSVKI